MPGTSSSPTTRPIARRAVQTVDDAARALVAAVLGKTDASLGLAVSGGCDSMVLMDAVHRAIVATGMEASYAGRIRVLTFDHGTGAHASVASALVVNEARRRSLEVILGRGSLAGASEAEWRAARWSFFRQAMPSGATVATAHTRDDQLETVVMRAMRAAGARGLAGLAASREGIARPLLAVSRDALRQYARTRDVPFLDDPSNQSRRHFRNRVRHDLLPAIRRVRPRFADDLLDVAEEAATWRAEVDDVAAHFVMDDTDGAAIRVARHELATYDSAALCVLWPAIAAHARVTLDRRGTQRLAQFTTLGAPGARIQVSGGMEVVRQRDSFVFRALDASRVDIGDVPLVGVVQFGAWRFAPTPSGEPQPTRSRPAIDSQNANGSVDVEDRWACGLPADSRLVVRAWRPADRMCAIEGGAARRVKRFFGDAQIAGPSRAGWPVVLADDEIVWIPGVRRRVAAPERSGRPVIRYVCRRFDGGHPNS